MLTKIYDITDITTSGKIEKIAEIAGEMDSSIRDTYIPSLEENASKDPDEFAVTLYHPRHGFMSKYASHSKGLAQLNIAILASQINELPDEIIKVAATNLEKAAAHYKIDFPEELKQHTVQVLDNSIVDVTNIDQTAYHEKLAKFAPKVEHVYALPELEKYPITDEDLLKEAESYFNVYSHEFEINDRIEFAKNAAAQMEKLSIKPSGLIDKLAHLDFNKLNDDFKYHIKSRQTLTHDEESVSLYGDLLEKSAELDPIKIAKALSKIDENSGIIHYYGKKVEDPISTVFGINKEAEYEIDERLWKESDFNKIAEHDFSNLIDNDTSTELSSVNKIDVFKSLPKPIRDSIANEIL